MEGENPEVVNEPGVGAAGAVAEPEAERNEPLIMFVNIPDNNNAQSGQNDSPTKKRSRNKFIACFPWKSEFFSRLFHRSRVSGIKF